MIPKRIKSVREYYSHLVLSVLLIAAFICSMIYALSTGNIRTIGRDFLKGCAVFLILASMLLFGLVYIQSRIPHFKEKVEIEQNLIKLGVFYQTGIKDVVEVPKLSLSDESIILKLDNPLFRLKLEAHIESLSTVLPSYWVVNRVSLNRSQNEMKIDYVDSRLSSRRHYQTVEDFMNDCNSLGYTEYRLDGRHIIHLGQTPHILITGTTGSGKSYYSQQLILQSLVKGHEVVILDFKRSYQAFSECCTVAFDSLDIIDALQNVIYELHDRQKKMDDLLKKDPQAQAHIEGGYPLLIVVVEEYLALVNSNIEKKDLNFIEKSLVEICTTGRSLGIVLVMIMQQADAASLPTKIRSNLPAKLAFGDCSRSVYETTFGIGNSPKSLISFEKGEGYAMLDSATIFTFSAPSLEFKVPELLSLLVAKH